MTKRYAFYWNGFITLAYKVEVELSIIVSVFQKLALSFCFVILPKFSFMLKFKFGLLIRACFICS